MGEIFESSGGQYDTVPPIVNVISDSNNTVLGTANLETSLYGLTLPLGMAYDSGKGEIFICDSGYDATTGYTYNSGVLVMSDSNNTAITKISIPVLKNRFTTRAKVKSLWPLARQRLSYIGQHERRCCNRYSGKLPPRNGLRFSKGRSVCVQRRQWHYFGDIR